MKYEIILSNEEIERILNIKAKNLGEAIIAVEELLNDYDFKNSRKLKFAIQDVLGVAGKLENNPKELICPNCNGKYVVNTIAGDLYYGFFNGSETQKNAEKKKFEKMELYSNPWACENYFTRDFQCLNCGIRWNGKNEDIYKDIEELNKNLENNAI